MASHVSSLSVTLGRGRYFLRPRTFVRLDYYEFYPLSFVQRAIALGYDVAVVNENVPTAIALDETIALDSVEPLDCTSLALCHNYFPSILA